VGEVTGDVLPLALGVAISPVPIIAVILMLFAPRANRTSTGFLIGWVTGIVGSVVVFVLVAGSLNSDQDAPSATISWIKLVLGLLLLGLAFRRWRNRSTSATEPELPAWMKAIDEVTPLKASGIGFLLSALNPKNLAMAAAAGVAIGGAELTAGQATVSVVVFVVIATSTVAVPVIAYAVAPDRMRGPLNELKLWLEANNATVLTMLLLVIGFVVFGKGLGGLL
jgi:threonine/homoserine/homoserine lactone efflux protein